MQMTQWKEYDITHSFDNERPIYLQLMEMIKIQIISGKIKPGEKLPSVRDYAHEVKVNPNTVQKALTELERENLIYTERTNGKYVTDNSSLINQLKTKIANNLIIKFIEDMNDIGISKEEIITYLKKKGMIKIDANWM